MSKPVAEGEKNLATNARAFHLYHIVDRFEAGLVLLGSEVKAIREAASNLRDAYATVRDGEAFLMNCHVGVYSHTGYTAHDPLRPRKLLLTRRELHKLESKLTLKGLTLVPLRLYTKKGKIKVELGLAEGKKLHDKREDSKRKDADREMAKAIKHRNRD